MLENIIHSNEVEEVLQDDTKEENLGSSGDHKDDLTHMLSEDLIGRIIALPPWTPIYRFCWINSETGSEEILFELNAFRGDVTFKVPKDFPKAACADLLASLKIGTIVLADEEVKLDKQDVSNRLAYAIANDQTTINARIAVSETNINRFKDYVAGVRNKDFLVRCIDVELMEKNRKEFLDVMRSRLNQLS